MCGFCFMLQCSCSVLFLQVKKLTYKFVSVEERFVFACLIFFGECVQGMKKIKNEEEKRKYYYRL